MIYLALLRGINVGGKAKIDMRRLKSIFEEAGMKDVKTYINSGNVIFKNENHPGEIIPVLEKAIEKQFGFNVKVLLRDLNQIKTINEALPKNWINNAFMKCDVMFLWDKFDDEALLNKLIVKQELEDVKYIPGAIIWRVDRVNVNKSGMLKIVGTELYKHMTVRNCNTVRKLCMLMESSDSGNV